MSNMPISVGDGIRAWPHDDGTWTVSDQGGWHDGIFDSRETAIAAARGNWPNLTALQDVWRHDGENRPATMDDLKRAGVVE